MKPLVAFRLAVALSSLLAVRTTGAAAQAPGPAAGAAPRQAAAPPTAPSQATTPAPLEPKRFVSHRVGRFNGREVRYAATAWYHGRVPSKPARLEDFLEEARRFAVDEYAPALLEGSRLDAVARAKIRQRLAYFTGLDESYIERSDLRVLADRFLKELMRSKGVALGRIDARYAVDDIDDVADRPAGDASSSALTGAFVTALQQHMAANLGVAVPWDYRPSNPEVAAKWKWRTVPEGRPWEPSYVNVAPRLAQSMRRNPALRVFVASGYYDYATPFFDADLVFAHYGFVPERTTMNYYETGHMMYVHEPSRQRLLADVRSFLSGR